MPIDREMILVPSANLSERGFDFEGQPISEDFNYHGYKIVYRKKLYDHGNRKGIDIELFSNKKFIMVVQTTEIRLLKI